MRVFGDLIVETRTCLSIQQGVHVRQCCTYRTTTVSSSTSSTRLPNASCKISHLEPTIGRAKRHAHCYESVYSASYCELRIQTRTGQGAIINPTPGRGVERLDARPSQPVRQTGRSGLGSANSKAADESRTPGKGGRLALFCGQSKQAVSMEWGGVVESWDQRRAVGGVRGWLRGEVIMLCCRLLLAWSCFVGLR